MSLEASTKPEQAKEKTNNNLLQIFSKWIFVGLILMLLSFLLKNAIGNANYGKIIIDSIIDLVFAVGTSVFIAAIFTWVLGTQEFMMYIKERLVNIVITKDFIRDLDYKKKSEMLKTLLRPGRALSKTYSRIEDYFNLYSERSIQLFQSNHFRAGLIIDAEAILDDGKVALIISNYYRTFAVDVAHEDFQIGMDDPESKVISVEIAPPKGGYRKLEVLEIEKEKSEDILKHDTASKKVYLAKIPEDLKSVPFLDVKLLMKEVGENHWINFSYRSTKTTDKLDCIVRCRDELIIRSHATYGNSDNFHVTQRSDSVIEISCNAWMDPGHGLNLLIAKDCSV